jgi:hypothetical protein
LFPLSGGYSIPTSNQPIKTLSTTSLQPLITTNPTTQPKQTIPPTDEVLFWYKAMRYGIVNLANYLIHAKDSLFYYKTMDKDQFIPETNLTSQFTPVSVSYLTPNNPIYHEVINHVIIERKTKQLQPTAAESNPTSTYSQPLQRYSTITSQPQQPPPANISPTSDVQAILEGLTAALTELTAKTMTGTKCEQAKDATNVKACYEILFATTTEQTDSQGRTHKQFHKATLNPGF